jgi:hypothetical protein
MDYPSFTSKFYLNDSSCERSYSQKNSNKKANGIENIKKLIDEYPLSNISIITMDWQMTLGNAIFISAIGESRADDKKNLFNHNIVLVPSNSPDNTEDINYYIKSDILRFIDVDYLLNSDEVIDLSNVNVLENISEKQENVKNYVEDIKPKKVDENNINPKKVEENINPKKVDENNIDPKKNDTNSSKIQPSPGSKSSPQTIKNEQPIPFSYADAIRSGLGPSKHQEDNQTINNNQNNDKNKGDSRYQRQDNIQSRSDSDNRYNNQNRREHSDNRYDNQNRRDNSDNQNRSDNSDNQNRREYSDNRYGTQNRRGNQGRGKRYNINS